MSADWEREVADEYLLCSPAIMLSSVIVGALAAAVANCRSLGVGNPEMVAPVDGVGWEHGGSTTDAIGLTGGLGDISAWNSSWETCICTKACMVGGSLFVRIAQLWKNSSFAPMFDMPISSFLSCFLSRMSCLISSSSGSSVLLLRLTFLSCLGRFFTAGIEARSFCLLVWLSWFVDLSSSDASWDSMVDLNGK